MSKQYSPASRRPGARRLLASLVAGTLLPTLASAQPGPPPAPRPAATVRLAPCTSIRIADPATIVLGKSTLINLPTPMIRLVVGGIGPGYAGQPVETNDARIKEPGAQSGGGNAKNGVADVDVMLLGPSELYLLGKRVGAMNLILQNQAGDCTVMDINVAMDSASLQAKLAELMPDEKNLKIIAADDSLIVSGEVSDNVKLDQVMTLAAAYAPEKRLVNLLQTSAASQVMLEVKVAEVSKTLLDRLGSSVGLSKTNGSIRYDLVSSFLSNGGAFASAVQQTTGKFGALDGEKTDGLVRILAEPNIMAISGQPASFLSGGKIFIPVAQSNAALGGVTITLEEKEFGVGVKFTPTVLGGGRINLKVASEVSELSQTGSPFTTVGNVTAVLPSFTTRRADTTVQLKDGQSFAIAGLIKNNMSETIKRFPILGEIPILGALFRSAEFQKDMTELLFVITPRLVKPLPAGYALPTDNFKEPGRANFLLGGKLEATPDAPPPNDDGRGAAAPDAAGQTGTAIASADAAARPAEPATTARLIQIDDNGVLNP